MIGFAATLALGLAGAETQPEYLGEVIIDPGTLRKLKRAPKARLVYNRRIKPEDLPQIGSSRDAESVFRKIFKSEMDVREMMVVLYLNRQNSVVAYYVVSRGGIHATLVDIRLILAGAVSCLCSSIILCHNHPSGTLKPSQADLDMTKKVITACSSMEIKLLDHLIITSESYMSFADNGLI